MHRALWLLTLLSLSASCDVGRAEVRSPAPGTARARVVPSPAPARLERERTERDAGEVLPSLVDTVSAQGRRARGLYFSAPWIHRYGSRGVIAALRNAGLDAAVIDVKDGQGRVSIDTAVPELAASKVRLLGDVRGLLAALHARGIYTVARIVCFNDPILAPAALDRAVRDARPRHTHEAWVSWGTGTAWLDPANDANQEMVRRLAVEAEALGFDEVQLDYVRFPVDGGVDYAVFPALAAGTRHWEIIARLLRRVDESLHVPLGIDVFGVAALQTGDGDGLGQSLEDLVPYVEVVTPMLYANAFRDWHAPSGGDRGPSLVATATSRLRARLGSDVVVRPYLQGFAYGAERFDEGFVARQVHAAHRSGADGFLFWDPGGDYATVEHALAAAPN